MLQIKQAFTLIMGCILAAPVTLESAALREEGCINLERMAATKKKRFYLHQLITKSKGLFATVHRIMHQK